MNTFDYILLVTAWSLAATVWGTGLILSRSSEKTIEDSDDDDYWTTDYYTTTDYCTSSDDDASVAESKSQVLVRKSLQQIYSSILKNPIVTSTPPKKSEPEKHNNHTCLCPKRSKAHAIRYKTPQ